MPKSRWEDTREREIRAKRDLILRAATAHLNQHGYAGASMARIAGELGLSTNAPYYYFRSKEEILFGCFLRAQSLIDGLIDDVQRTALAANEKIRQFVAELIALLEREPLPYPGHAIFLPPDRLAVVEENAARHETRLAAILADGIADGTVRECDPGITVRLLLNGLYSLDQPELKRRLPDGAYESEVLGMVERAL